MDIIGNIQVLWDTAVNTPGYLPYMALLTICAVVGFTWLIRR
jgi:hypothetical protein